MKRTESNRGFESNPAVLYIAGCGRSGSTILDTLIGTLDNVSSFGELRCLPGAVLSGEEYCACGTLVCEDLSEPHSGRVQALSDFVDVSKTDIVSRLDGRQPLTVGHTVAGNRMRMQQTVKVTIDESWKNDMPAGDRMWCTLLAAPFLARYGYLAA